MKTRTARYLLALQATAQALAVLIPPTTADADATAYVLNTTLRPGYHFANAQDAIGYGQHICDKVSQGRSYGHVVGDVKKDFGTTDEYQASYLVVQAVNELCPALIWQVRNSAAN